MDQPTVSFANSNQQDQLLLSGLDHRHCHIWQWVHAHKVSDVSSDSGFSEMSISDKWVSVFFIFLNMNENWIGVRPRKDVKVQEESRRTGHKTGCLIDSRGLLQRTKALRAVISFYISLLYQSIRSNFRFQSVLSVVHDKIVEVGFSLFPLE